MGFDINDYVGSGLFEGGRVIFRNPRFTRIPEYRDGQETLLLVDLLNVDEGGELTDQRFGLGNGWETNDDETEITEHRDGKKLKFNDSTAIGHFISSIPKEMVAALEAKWKAGEEVTPFKVGFYDGLDVTISQHSKDLTIDGDQVTQRWFEIDEFHGYEGDAKASKGAGKSAAKKAPAKKAAAKKAAPKAQEEPASEDWIPDESVIEKIVGVAAESENFDEFVANCFADIPEVSDGDDADNYQALVEDQSDDGIWETAVREWEAANS